MTAQAPCRHGHYNYCSVCGILTASRTAKPEAALVLDRPDQIGAWQLLAFYQMLKLEIKGLRHSSGRRASVEIRKILKGFGRPAPIDRQSLLREYERYLIDNRYLVRP